MVACITLSQVIRYLSQSRSRFLKEYISQCLNRSRSLSLSQWLRGRECYIQDLYHKQWEKVIRQRSLTNICQELNRQRPKATEVTSLIINLKVSLWILREASTKAKLKRRFKRLILIHTKAVLENGFLEVNLQERAAPSDTSNATRAIKLGCQRTQRSSSSRPAKAAINISCQLIFGWTIARTTKGRRRL
jgi:hypothetical protein